MLLSGWREFTLEQSHPGWYREFRRGGDDHDPGYIRFNERQQQNITKRV